MTPQVTRRRRRPWLRGATVGSVVAVVAMMSTGAAFARDNHVDGSQQIIGLDLDAPTGITVAGNDLYVANGGNSSVTEVNTTTATRIATISGRRVDLDDPTSILTVGADIFVSNGRGNSVTEFKVLGNKKVRSIHRAKYRFADPIALASSAGDLFILNAAGTVTEIAIQSGRLVGIVAGSKYGFDDPTGLAIADGLVFVANSAANSVTVFSATSRALIAVLTDPSFGFNTPTGVAFDGSDVWVTDQGDESVTELSPSTLHRLNVLVSGNLPMVGPITYGDGYVFAVSPPGSSPMVSQIVPSPASVTWMMCNTNGPYMFNDPQSLVVAGSNLWVANEGGNSLTEMDADTGALIRTVS